MPSPLARRCATRSRHGSTTGLLQAACATFSCSTCVRQTFRLERDLGQLLELDEAAAVHLDIMSAGQEERCKGQRGTARETGDALSLEALGPTASSRSSRLNDHPLQLPDHRRQERWGFCRQSWGPAVGGVGSQRAASTFGWQGLSSTCAVAGVTHESLDCTASWHRLRTRSERGQMENDVTLPVCRIKICPDAGAANASLILRQPPSV